VRYSSWRYDMVNRVLDLELEEDDPDCAIVPKSPYRTPWLKDLLRDTIAETPSVSNQVLRQQLSPYGKPYTLTDALIQAARTQLRRAIFGDPEENCQYVHHVVKALQAEGHIVELRTTCRCVTIQNVNRIVIADELLRRKEFDGSTLTNSEQASYVDKWMDEHADLLVNQLGSKNDGLTFLNGMFFVTSFAKTSVPYLKDMFMADACHLQFGKYTLFSCYGITAKTPTCPQLLLLFYLATKTAPSGSSFGNSVLTYTQR
jgi:hypothetical protein